MISRRQRSIRTKNRFLAISAAITVLVIILLRISITAWDQAVPASTTLPQSKTQATSLRFRWRDILSAGIPEMDEITNSQPVTIKPYVSPQSILRDTLLFLTQIDIEDIRSLLRVEIPAMALFGPTAKTKSIRLPDLTKLNLGGIFSDDKAIIGIYHTHTAESFIPDSGTAHKPGGQRGDIVDVGEAMVKRFAQHGVPAVQSKNVHDFPSFMKAYDKSEITVRQMLKEHPSLQALFDVHRDAGKRGETTVVIDGRAAARVLIVVAKGRPDLEQPHWQENYAFAKLIDAGLNRYYPGVSRGIEFEEWRYNQHLHPHALLLEIGSQESSKAEAIYTADMIADVVTEILATQKSQDYNLPPP